MPANPHEFFRLGILTFFHRQLPSCLHNCWLFGIPGAKKTGAMVGLGIDYTLLPTRPDVS